MMERQKPIMKTLNGTMAFLKEPIEDGHATISLVGNDPGKFTGERSEAARLMNGVIHMLKSEHPELTEIRAEGIVNGKMVFQAEALKSNDWAIKTTQSPELSKAGPDVVEYVTFTDINGNEFETEVVSSANEQGKLEGNKIQAAMNASRPKTDPEQPSNFLAERSSLFDPNGHLDLNGDGVGGPAGLALAAIQAHNTLHLVSDGPEGHLGGTLFGRLVEFVFGDDEPPEVTMPKIYDPETNQEIKPKQPGPETANPDMKLDQEPNRPQPNRTMSPTIEI